MGTIYRTQCGCVASRPEPSIAEYDTATAYRQAHKAWAQEWERTVKEHAEEERINMAALERSA